MPAGKDGHTHDIEEILNVSPKKRDKKSSNKETEDERLSEYRDVFLKAKKDDEFYMKQAEVSEGMYFGDGQWESDVKGELESQQRPALVINKIEPKIKALIGYEIQNSTIPKSMPKEDGDAVVADILNGLHHHFFGVNDYSGIRNEVFEDIAVTGRGNYILRIDYSKNLEGDIIIERLPWEDVMYLEHDKKSAEDCEGVVFCRWISEGKLKLIAPKNKLKELEDNSIFESTTSLNGGEIIDMEKEGLISHNTKRIRLVQVQRKEFSKRTAIANPNDDYYLDGMEGRVPGWLLDKKTVDSLLTIPGFEKVERVVQEIWVGVFAGGILLYDTLSPFSDFTLIPGYATKRKNKVKGKVYDLLDPQREINKRRSTMSDLASKLSASGVYYDQETFSDESQKEAFLEERSTPGFAIEIDNLDKMPVRETAVPLPRDLVMLEDQSSRDLNEISGINEELIGADSNAQSARLYVERRNAALIGNEYLFTGLSAADKSLTKRMIEAYRFVLTPERVYRILENSNRKMKSEGGLKLGDVGFEKYPEEEIKKIWETFDISKYDIAVGFGENSPTKKAADFKMWSDLGKQGLENVNAEFLLEMADVAPDQREKLNGIAQQRQQQAMQLEQKKLSIEENKTQLAAQSRERIELED